MDLEVARFYAVSTFYVMCNFMPLGLLCALYLVCTGSWWGWAIVVVFVVDLALPMKQPGLNITWCKLTDDVKGKEKYFGAECIVEGEFKKDKNYLVGYHPHSLYGICYNMYTKHLYEKYGIEPLFTAADVVLYIPILRRMLTAWGVTPVNGPAMKKNLTLPYPNNVLTLMPGGISEMFYGVGEHEQIILKKRMGFCKIALQTGASLVPCYAFGVSNIWTRWFDQHSLISKLSSMIRVSLVVWTGRWGIPFGPIPHQQKIMVALAPPIDVDKVENPTGEQIETLHNKYCTELQALFNRHKGKMGWDDKVLFFEDVDPRRMKKD